MNVVAEYLLPETIVEERSLVEQRQATKIPEHEADDVENSRWLQNDGVLARRYFFRRSRLSSFLCGSLGHSTRIDVACVGRVRLLPTGGVRRRHRNAGLGHCLAVPALHAERVEDAFDLL